MLRLKEELKAFKRMIAEMNTVAEQVEAQEIQASNENAQPAETGNEGFVTVATAGCEVQFVSTAAPSREVQSVFTAPSAGFFTP